MSEKQSFQCNLLKAETKTAGLLVESISHEIYMDFLVVNHKILLAGIHIEEARRPSKTFTRLITLLQPGWIRIAIFNIRIKFSTVLTGCLNIAVPFAIFFTLNFIISNKSVPILYRIGANCPVIVGTQTAAFVVNALRISGGTFNLPWQTTCNSWIGKKKTFTG